MKKVPESLQFTATCLQCAAKVAEQHAPGCPNAIPRPDAVVWRGPQDGLPPVGVEVWAKIERKLFGSEVARLAKVIAVKGSWAWCLVDDAGLHTVLIEKLAPIKNEPGFGAELTPRPAVTAWRGPEDGLPPVGTEVEAQDGYSWKIGTVVAHVWEACFGDMVIIQCEGFWAASDATGIRPVKTERERAIEEMVKVVEAANQLKTVKLVCNALYDAGYRKGEPTCSTK